MFISFTMVITNLTVDIIYGWLDPRVSIDREAE